MPSNEINSCTSNQLTSCLILLNGFPGVGKFSIARALEAKLKLHDIPSRLLDNHLLIDPVLAIEPIRNVAHYNLRKTFRKAAFEGLKALKHENPVIIFTAALSTSNLLTPYDDIEHFQEYVDLACSMAVPLLLVNIICDLNNNRERLCSDERKGTVGKTKLTDGTILEKLRRDNFILSREDAMSCKREGDLVYVELNTSHSTIEQATFELWQRLSSIGR